MLEFFAFLTSQCLSPCDHANYIDSKVLKVCHIKREKQHKVFEGFANKGKSSLGWFFGLKLHLITNSKGQLCQFLITSGNKSDNNIQILESMFKGIKGTIFGDKGYLSKHKQYFQKMGVKLIAKHKKNMKKEVLNIEEKFYIKKRGIIETIFGMLAFQCNIDHSRHRSIKNFFINTWSALIAYTFLDHKPAIQNISDAYIKYQDIVLI